MSMYRYGGELWEPCPTCTAFVNILLYVWRSLFFRFSLHFLFQIFHKSMQLIAPECLTEGGGKRTNLTSQTPSSCSKKQNFRSDNQSAPLKKNDKYINMYVLSYFRHIHKWQFAKSQVMNAHVYMYVHALEQLGTFVVAWPRTTQCLLCSGEERASALAQIHAHTHTQTFPWIPRVGKGLNRNLGHAGILNPLSQKQPFTPQPRVTRSTFLGPVSYLRHTAITRNWQIYIFSHLAQAWPQQIPTTVVFNPHAGSCAYTLKRHLFSWSSPPPP